MYDDFLFVDLTGDRKLLRDIDAIPDIVRDVLKEKIEYWTQLMQEQVIQNIQERLKAKTGDLENSVRMEIVEDGLRVDGHVYIQGVPHAAYQEKGAIIPPHEILPRNAKVLAFIAATGDKVFAARVFHPGGVILPKYFMRDAYRFVSPKITRGLRYYIVEKFNRRRKGG